MRYVGPLLFLFVLFVVFGGCGADEWEQSLPNGYRITDTGTVYVLDPSRQLALPFSMHETIDGFEVKGAVVYGHATAAQPPADAYYFILDTSNGERTCEYDEKAWRSILASRGITRVSLSMPWNPLERIIVAGASAVVAALIALGVWLLVRSRRRWKVRREALLRQWAAEAGGGS